MSHFAIFNIFLIDKCPIVSNLRGVSNEISHKSLNQFKMSLKKSYLKKFLLLIAVRGGTGKFSIKCLNEILFQLRVMGGGVNLIHTKSQNMFFLRLPFNTQFFVKKQFNNISCLRRDRGRVFVICCSYSLPHFQCASPAGG